MLTWFGPIRPDGAFVPVAGPPVIRRRITPGAGKALEILAHAQEYLSDECVVCDAMEAWLRAQMDAIKLLKYLNLGIYLDCPEAPTAGDRCRGFFRRCFKDPGPRKAGRRAQKRCDKVPGARSWRLRPFGGGAANSRICGAGRGKCKPLGTIGSPAC